MILNKQLRSLLKDHDLTVAQLARATHVNAKTLYQWLYGQKPRNLEQVKKVADHFKVSIDYLVFDTPSVHQPLFSELQKEINAGVYEVILRRVNDHEAS